MRYLLIVAVLGALLLYGWALNRLWQTIVILGCYLLVFLLFSWELKPPASNKRDKP